MGLDNDWHQGLLGTGGAPRWVAFWDTWTVNLLNVSTRCCWLGSNPPMETMLRNHHRGLKIYHESVSGRCSISWGRFLDRTKISWHKGTEMCGPSVFKLMFNEPAVTMCPEMARQNFNCPIHESRHSQFDVSLSGTSTVNIFWEPLQQI